MTNGDIVAGGRAIRVISALKNLPKNSHELRDVLKEALSEDGFQVKTEATVTYWKGNAGRIDIVARKDDGLVAIELNGRSLNARSVSKLRRTDGYRILTLKGKSYYCRQPEGIQAVVKLDVA